MNLVNIAAKRLLPDFASRLRVRRLINLPLDAYDHLVGRRDPLVPPRGLWFVGGRKNYKATNELYLSQFIRAGLEPHHAVLDIGCGIGVMAARLTNFLTIGSYDGFDIVKVGTDWASNHISSQYPNFRFFHADVYNRHYNPGGQLKSETFSFPYPDNAFDFAFAKSVFTHMLPQGVQQYLYQTARTLKPTAIAVLTAFLINDDSIGLVQSGRSSLQLSNTGGNWVLDPEFPETTVGLDETALMRWCEEAGFTVTDVAYGSWCGRSSALSYQDMITIRRQPQSPDLSQRGK